jgi:hypothetical protein
MRRILQVAAAVTVLTACLMPVPALADTVKALGVEGGVSIGEFSGGDTEILFGDPTQRIGFVGGVYFLAIYEGKYGLRLEGLFAQRGARGTISDAISMSEVEYQLNYIEFPATALYMLPVSDKVAFNAFAGLSLGFSLKGELVVVSGTPGVPVDVSDDVRFLEFAGVVGAGLDIDLGGVILQLNGRYNYGLQTVFDSDRSTGNPSDPQQTFGDLDIRNTPWSVMIGAAFPFPEY